nr:type IV secretory system conjugative DNA transfer family protein [Haematobacter sp.]
MSQSLAALYERKLYGRLARLALQAGAPVQLFMTPQETHTAEAISDLLGKRTVVAKSESGRRVRSLSESASLSRRSEERPLMTPGELLRFPLDEVIVLPQGQPPIRARHIRYYEDRQFRPLVASQNGERFPYPPPSVADIPSAGVTVLRVKTPDGPSTGEESADDPAELPASPPT